MSQPWIADPPNWLLSSLLKHCQWEERALLCCVSKKWHSRLSGCNLYWKQLVSLLVQENRLYVDPSARSISDWKSVFLDLWRIRNIWSQCPSTAPASSRRGDEIRPHHKGECPSRDSAQLRFAIRVCARFCPYKPAAGESARNGAASLVVLPFHQRIQMIKARFSKGISTQKAATILMDEIGMGREARQDPWESAALRETTTREESGQGMEADILPRPIMSGKDHKASILSVVEGRHGTVLAVAPGVGLREFAFDFVFGVNVGQAEVFSSAASSLVSDVMNGLNGTLLVFGQTGSGKTHTVFGPHETEGGTTFTGSPRGVVPRVFEEVFSAIDARRAVGIEAEVAMSYVEVYGQEVYDMLRGGIAVGQSRVAGQRYVLDGKCQLVVESLRDVAVLLDQAEAFKRKAVTAMNERSTRAHSLVVLTLCQTEMTTGIKRTSMFSIADLGGSEQLSKSLANEGLKHIGSGTWAEYYEARERLSEATWINTGLFALKRCIDALNDRQAALDSGRALPHVPYQDSKLTQLLSDALGGSSRTTIIVTASLDPQHAVETVQSLRFGERCSTVQNTAGLRGNALQKAIAGLTSGIHALETEIQKKERWEQRRVVRKDIEGTEVMCISVVTGAEEERRKLESLLTQRRKLLGQPEPQQNYPSRPGNSFHHGLDASAMLNP